jgi:FtsZ-binding cell division protein ZapB
MLGRAIWEGSTMTLDRLDALEVRIRDLVKLVQELKRKNATLEEEMKAARQRMAAQDDLNRQWEKERIDIKSRIEKVIGEIELLECVEDPKEVALD